MMSDATKTTEFSVIQRKLVEASDLVRDLSRAACALGDPWLVTKLWNQANQIETTVKRLARYRDE